MNFQYFEYNFEEIIKLFQRSENTFYFCYWNDKLLNFQDIIEILEDILEFRYNGKCKTIESFRHIENCNKIDNYSREFIKPSVIIDFLCEDIYNSLFTDSSRGIIIKDLDKYKN